MALTIRDISGVDLQLNPPTEVIQTATPTTATAGFYCIVAEDDLDLPSRFVSADVDWNDGTAPVHYPTSSSVAVTESPQILNPTRALPVGTYAITVTATNNRAPTPDTAKATFLVTIEPRSAQVVPANRLYGPIIPRDSGLPNKQTWVFDTGSDLAVLVSSVKMLLITAKGERVMFPDYGTNLRKVLFEPNLEAIESVLQQEINTALARYEPRVRVVGLTVIRNENQRSVTVEGTFVSRLAARPFDISLDFKS